MRFRVPEAALIHWDGLRLCAHNWTPSDTVSIWPKDVGDSAGHTSAPYVLKKTGDLDLSSVVGPLG